jgi:hypothetical protein
MPLMNGTEFLGKVKDMYPSTIPLISPCQLEGSTVSFGEKQRVATIREIACRSYTGSFLACFLAF